TVMESSALQDLAGDLRGQIPPVLLLGVVGTPGREGPRPGRTHYLLGSWSNRRDQFPNRLEVVFFALADADSDAVANSLDRPVCYSPSKDGGLNRSQQSFRDFDLWGS